MSVVRLATLAAYLALAFAMAPAAGQASAVEPSGFHTFSQFDHAVLRRALSPADGYRVAHQGAALQLTTRSATPAPSPLPLGGWLLGAVLLGLAAAEFRGNSATRS